MTVRLRNCPERRNASRKTPLRLEKRPLLVKQLSSSLQVAILEIRSRVLRFLSTHKFFLACAEEKPELKSNSGATFNWGQPATHLARKPSLRKDSRSNLIWVFVTAAPPASQPLATSLQKKNGLSSPHATDPARSSANAKGSFL